MYMKIQSASILWLLRLPGDETFCWSVPRKGGCASQEPFIRGKSELGA
jgi:hypothetical protein